MKVLNRFFLILLVLTSFAFLPVLAAVGDITALGPNDEFRVTAAGNLIVTGSITGASLSAASLGLTGTLTVDSTTELKGAVTVGKNGSGGSAASITLRDGNNPGTTETLTYAKWNSLNDTSGVVKSNGSGTFSAASTTDLGEGTNLYYLDSRARSAISESATGLDYTSSTGVLSLTSGYVIPTTGEQSSWTTGASNASTAIAWKNSLDLLSGVLKGTTGTYTTATTADLPENTNLYFTTARARGAVSAGAGISYDSTTGVITNSAPFSFTNSVTGLDWTSSTTTLSLNAGYIIPTTGAASGYDSAVAWHTTMDALNGILKSNGSGTFSAITDNHTNWDSGYSQSNTALAWQATVNGLTGLLKCDGAGNVTATTDNHTNWDTAYSNGNTALAWQATINGLTGVINGAAGTYTALTVGTGASNLVQLNGSSQLPAVSGALLTNLPSQVAGSNAQVQYNDSGAMAGADVEYIKSTGYVGIGASGADVNSRLVVKDTDHCDLQVLSASSHQAAVHLGAVGTNYWKLGTDNASSNLFTFETEGGSDVFTVSQASQELTFAQFPVTPSAAPDANYEVANKKYVDDAGPATVFTTSTNCPDGVISGTKGQIRIWEDGSDFKMCICGGGTAWDCTP